jgi:hypothetical protein
MGDIPEGLAPEHHAEWTRLHGELREHRAAKNHDGVEQTHERMLDLLQPERKQQREARQSASAQRALQPLQFFHGTDAPLRKGDHVQSARSLGRPANWNYGNNDFTYATPSISAAHIYARDIADMHQSSERIYQVEPTGNYEPDPDDAGSYRSTSPWSVVRRVPRKDWNNSELDQ